ncbi:MAG TPA: phosphotransferase [Kofleriaceae bacterium]|nr:phosphotransferase [Kofleriaceae bacterium]
MRDPRAAIVEHVVPGAEVIEIAPLAPDDGDGETKKVAGYGQPARIRLRDGRELVWHTASANEFGHDRRSDRAQELLLAYDDFARVPRHVRAIDVGAVIKGGAAVSLRDADELYLITTYAPGRVYADELREAAARGVTARDRARVDALTSYLAELHAERGTAAGYRRAIRDLVGHGEGIFGVIDGYPEGVVSRARLAAIEARCVEWRWRLRDRAHRAARTHGDFHPFNVVFAPDDTITVLDASRGTQGDPADDWIAMGINYVFFGVRSLWERYWAACRDDELFDVAPPFLAWRALVLANPRFYPSMPAATRDDLLSWIERVLDRGRFDPSEAPWS